MILCNDVLDLDVDDLRGSRAEGTQPVIKLVQTRRALIRGCAAAENTGTFLAVRGDQTEKIVLMNNELSLAKQMADIGAEVPRGVVKIQGNVSG